MTDDTPTGVLSRSELVIPDMPDGFYDLKMNQVMGEQLKQVLAHTTGHRDTAASRAAALGDEVAELEGQVTHLDSILDDLFAQADKIKQERDRIASERNYTDKTRQLAAQAAYDLEQAMTHVHQALAAMGVQ